MGGRFWSIRKSPPLPDGAPAPDEDGARPAVPRATVILLAFGGAAAAVFGLWALRSVVAPVFLALVLTICVHPVRRLLLRIHVPRGVATITAILLVFSLLTGFIAALIIALAQFTTLLPEFAPQFQQLGQDIGSWLESIGIGAEQSQVIISGLDPSAFANFAAELLGGVTGIIFALVVVFTLLMLMAMDATYLPALMTQLKPSRPSLVNALVGYTASVRRYMVAATGLGVLQAAMNWVALVLMQIPGAFLWSLLSFLCSFIPNVGYFIAIIPPTIFGLLIGGWPGAIGVIVAYGLINVVVQSIVQPLVVSDVVALNQTLTFVSVLFWALVLGPVGAVLAVPLTLLVRAILIDADPRARWWRPLTGDIDQVRGALKSADAEAKSERIARKRSAKNA